MYWSSAWSGSYSILPFLANPAPENVLAGFLDLVEFSTAVAAAAEALKKLDGVCTTKRSGLGGAFASSVMGVWGIAPENF